MNDEYQRLQQIYLDWHQGHRPLSGYINAIIEATKPDENTSDGYHTFKELYDHRIALFIALAKSHSDISWKAIKHDDGTSMDGWFIAGMHLPTGDISYHLPMSEWDRLDLIEPLTLAPKWDGHTPSDVVERINKWLDEYE